jgi:hypothetical protein
MLVPDAAEKIAYAVRFIRIDSVGLDQKNYLEETTKMSQKKKLDESARAGYRVGFRDAMDFVDLALANVKGVGPVLRQKIIDQIRAEVHKRNEAVKQGKEKLINIPIELKK